MGCITQGNQKDRALLKMPKGTRVKYWTHAGKVDGKNKFIQEAGTVIGVRILTRKVHYTVKGDDGSQYSKKYHQLTVINE